MKTTLIAKRITNINSWDVEKNGVIVRSLYGNFASKVVNKFATFNKKIPNVVSIIVSNQPFEGMQGALIRKLPYVGASYAYYHLEGADENVFTSLCNQGLKNAIRRTPQKIYFQIEKTVK